MWIWKLVVGRKDAQVPGCSFCSDHSVYIAFNSNTRILSLQMVELIEQSILSKEHLFVVNQKKIAWNSCIGTLIKIKNKQYTYASQIWCSLEIFKDLHKTWLMLANSSITRPSTLDFLCLQSRALPTVLIPIAWKTDTLMILM